jgi:uncharacterized protein YgfB (UPF0149 family)
MSAPSLPDFDRTLQLSRGMLDAAGLAECHGLLCGLACHESRLSVGEFLQHLAAMQLVVSPGQALHAVLVETWESTLAQIKDEEFSFALWLPDDDEPLEERTVALARWCSGFLAGLGSGGQLDALSAEAREAIGDLQEIARAEPTPHDGSGSVDAEESLQEEDEAAYAEIVEYVRVVALMMREDFRGPGEHDAIH